MTIRGQESQRGEALAPLKLFDRPPLHRRPTNVVAAQANQQMDMIVRKECAGLRHDLRTTGSRFRHAFVSGRFGRNERVTLEWVVAGMSRARFSTWHSLCALTIYELARGMRLLGPAAGGFAEYLNRWAEDPNLPLPSAAGWTLYIHDFSNLPRAAIEMEAADPRRQDIREIGVSILDLDGLRYSLPTEELQKIRVACGLDSIEALAHQSVPHS